MEGLPDIAGSTFIYKFSLDLSYCGSKNSRLSLVFTLFFAPEYYVRGLSLLTVNPPNNCYKRGVLVQWRTMVNYTAMLLLGMAWSVFSQPGSNPWPPTGTRVSLRILKRNQLDQFTRNQMEGFETSDRFHRVTRNNELLFGRLNRINKRNMADIPRQIEIDNQLDRLQEKVQTRLRAMGNEDLEKHGVLGFWIF